MKRRGGIYVHIPVCRRKCLYCSFYSVGERFVSSWHRLISAFLAELDTRISDIKDWEKVTIYIGGGTPSLMPPGEFQRLMKGLQERLLTANPNMEITEVTVEVNPDDVSDELAQVWKATGVNRISMGVQSLVDAELRAIGRRHDAETAVKAREILSQYFDNISLDLIFGLPGQTLGSLKTTLEGLIAMHPKHISAYSLMYEERSALTRLRDAGKIEETDEDITVRMFNLINDILSHEGLHRYEISNYSVPGFESCHNSSYWQGLPYVGLGPSAHSYDGAKVRRWNIADIGRYIDGVENDTAYFDFETLDDMELMEERIMTGLRTSTGINLGDYERDFGIKEREMLLGKAKKMKDSGYVEEADGFLRLTDKGIMISDEIIVQLF